MDSDENVPGFGSKVTVAIAAELIMLPATAASTVNIANRTDTPVLMVKDHR